MHQDPMLRMPPWSGASISFQRKLKLAKVLSGWRQVVLYIRSQFLSVMHSAAYDTVFLYRETGR